MKRLSGRRLILGLLHIIGSIVIVNTLFLTEIYTGELGFNGLYIPVQLMLILPISLVAAFNLFCGIWVLKGKRLLWSVGGLISVGILLVYIFIFLTALAMAG